MIVSYSRDATTQGLGTGGLVEAEAPPPPLLRKVKKLMQMIAFHTYCDGSFFAAPHT